MIDYQTQKLGINVGVTEAFSVGLDTEKKDVHTAGKMAEVLDDYQFLMCRDNQNLSETDPEFKKYKEERKQVIKIFTALRGTLIAYQNDQEGQRENLNKIVKDMNEFLVLTRKNPHDAGFLYKKTMMLTETGQEDEAVKNYDEAIKLDSKSAGFYYQKGITLVKLERFEEAIENFDKAIKQESADPGFHYKKGEVLMNLKKYEEAVKSFDEAILIDPKSSGFWYKRGIVLEKLNQMEKAVKSFDEAINLASEDSGLWYDRGLLQIKLNNLDKGLSDLKKAIEIGGNKVKEQAKFDERFIPFKNDERFNELIT